MPSSTRVILTNAGMGFEDYSFEELIGALKDADDHYFNTGNELVEDNLYDIAKRSVYAQNPAHVYFTGIGSDVRGGKIKLPFQMGSLDQVYEGEIEDWINKNQLTNTSVLISDKLDGTSAMIVYGDDGNLQIAYSRGNGLEGADITRHIKHIPSVPQSVSGPMVVRTEVIIPVNNFDALKSVQKRSDGSDYKNPRNAVAGIMNSKSNKTAAYKYIDVVAYEVVGNQMAKEDQLDLLKHEGFIVPGYALWRGAAFNDTDLTDYLNHRRATSVYELDGVVLDVNDEAQRARMNPTKTTLNPAYAVKYKVASADNEKNVRVIEVEWNVSKHGYLKPRVRIEPTELMGVTIQHATGFNAKFIAENSIGKGAIIKITRSGDVIPFILKTVSPGLLELPKDAYWNDTKVDLVATSGAAADEAYFKQVADFFASIEAPYLKEGSIRKMFDNDFGSIEKIIQAEEIDFIVALGKNGQKVYEGLVKRLNNIYFHDFVGSTPFFGRGVGKRKFKKLFEAIDRNEFMKGNLNGISSAEGFDTKTAVKIKNGLPKFIAFVNEVKDYITIVEPKITGITMNGQMVVFTGFRDKGLQAEVEANGGKMQSAISGKTTILVAANPTSNSGKMQKARANGTQIVGVDDFRELLR